MPTLRYERTTGGGSVVCGIDEAGRGPLAGPVVAAAVVLPDKLPRCLRRVDDSKKLDREAREELFLEITTRAHVGIGSADVIEIERYNILGATMLAMGRAHRALPVPAAWALVDGNRPPLLSCPVRCLVGGDALSLSIAAASIVAKVTRDREMIALAEQHPGYGWETNVGYGTPEHCEALLRLGVTAHHRRGFAPVAAVLAGLELPAATLFDMAADMASAEDAATAVDAAP